MGRPYNLGVGSRGGALWYDRMAGLEAFVQRLYCQIAVGKEVGTQELALPMVSWACLELLLLLLV